MVKASYQSRIIWHNQEVYLVLMAVCYKQFVISSTSITGFVKLGVWVVFVNHKRQRLIWDNLSYVESLRQAIVWWNGVNEVLLMKKLMMVLIIFLLSLLLAWVSDSWMLRVKIRHTELISIVTNQSDLALLHSFSYTQCIYTLWNNQYSIQMMQPVQKSLHTVSHFLNMFT